MLKLFPSQENYLARLGDKPLMFASMGSGKTAMSLFRAKRAGANKVLVICPATVRDTKVWEKDLEKFGLSFDEFEVQSHAYLQKYKTHGLPMKYQWHYIIIDEAHRIANSQSKQGQGAYHLIMQNRVGYSLLSGTPMSKWADACVDAATDVLTDGGWVSIADVTTNDKVAQYNAVTREISFAKPLRTIAKTTNEIVKITTLRGSNQVYTPDHKMLFYKKDSKGITHARDVLAINAKLYHQARIPVSGIGIAPERKLTNKERVYIAIQADGWHRKDRGTNNYRIMLKRPRKIQRLEKILSSSGLKYNELKNSRGYKEWSIWVDKGINCKDMRSFLPIECSYSFAREILNEVKQWDGYSTTHGYGYSQKDHPEQLDYIEAIACQAGYATSRHGNGFKIHWFERFDRSTNRGIKTIEAVNNMPVYCVTTNTGYFVARRDHRVFITGNCNYAKITGLVAHKTEFYRRFVIEQPSYAHKGKDIVGYRDVETLTNWWNSIALRGRSEEFVELPSKQMIDVSIPVKRKGYVDMIKTRMRGDEPLDSAPKMNWALRQFAETAPEKLNWVVEKIEGLENCIVFTNTIAAMDALGAKLDKAGIKYGMWRGDRKDKFDDHKVMLVQYQSGGTGLNLQAFNATIFLSPCYSYIDYSQAIARTHRTGQEKRCVFYRLQAERTIDGAIYKALAQKKNFDDKLNVEEANS